MLMHQTDAFGEPDRGMDSVEKIAAGLLAFSIAAMNGRPLLLSSGIACLFVTFVLGVNHLRRRGLTLEFPAGAGPIIAIWLVWLFAATLSLIANPEMETLSAWFWSFLVPTGVLLTVLGLRPSRGDAVLILCCLAAGWLVRYAYSGWVFYQSWGVLNLTDILFAHFNLERMIPYAEATYGNTSRTAAIIVPALVATSLAMILTTVSWRIRLLLGATILALVLNALITGSRGQMLIVFMTLALAGLKSSRRGGVAIIALAVVALGYFISNLDFDTLGRFSMVLSTDRFADESIRGRWDSIDEGIQLMLHHPFGVGPGLSYKYSLYTVAHQFHVYQGSELGVLGFLATASLFVVIGYKFVVARLAGSGNLGFIFKAAAFAWCAFATIANSPLGTGPNIPWAALFALLVAMGEIMPSNPVTPRAPPEADHHPA